MEAAVAVAVAVSACIHRVLVAPPFTAKNTGFIPLLVPVMPVKEKRRWLLGEEDEDEDDRLPPTSKTWFEYGGGASHTPGGGHWNCADGGRVDY